MRNLKLIAAIGLNNELGYQNNLIWRIKEDLQYFKEKTYDSYIIMGRKTYESLPKKLENRKYIILSNSIEQIPEETMVFSDIDSLINFVENNSNEIFFVIGGGQIYNQLLPYVNEMYLTEIEETFERADIYFPKFDKNEWKRIIESTYADNLPKYNHVKYIKE